MPYFLDFPFSHEKVHVESFYRTFVAFIVQAAGTMLTFPISKEDN